MFAPLRLLIAVPRSAEADRLRQLVASRPDAFAIPVCVHTLRDAVAAARGGCDAVLLDLRQPDAGGLDAYLRFKTAHPGLAVLVLADPADEVTAVTAVRAGAQDYLLDGEACGRRLGQAVRTAVDREQLLTDERAAAVRDPLTGLANRRGLFAIGPTRAAGADAAGVPVSVVLIDLDGLKGVNDAHGHAAGDELLTDVAGVIREVFRLDDLIARLGGDEFAVLAVGADAITAERLVARLEEKVNRFNAARCRPYELALSAGVATSNRFEPTVLDQLLATADLRMYAAKRERRSVRLGIPAARHHAPA